MTGFEFGIIVCGTLFAIGLVTFLVAGWQLRREKHPPYDQGS